MSERILVTGGAGYIGSHSIVCLLEAGYEVDVLDNLSNSSKSVLDRIAEISGRRVKFFQQDLLDFEGVKNIFKSQSYQGVLHFAGLKSVADSVRNPESYFENNVRGSVNLLSAMAESQVRKLVFSSSAAVYGSKKELPICEDARLNPESPYGRSKQMIEQILRELSSSDPSWRICALRYFNPVGAHSSGLIGENPMAVPSNLVPYVVQVAAGELDCVQVYGGNYETEDGTGKRDYIHVMDLAEGHLRALEYATSFSGYTPFNLGTGTTYSVLEIISNLESISGRPIPYKIVGRREGDVSESCADPSLSRERLKWKASRDLVQMLSDQWIAHLKSASV